MTLPKSFLYTKRGDKGKTSLVDGSECSKNDNRIELYGSIDELNSFLGILASAINQDSPLELERTSSFLKNLQDTLFILGSNFACPYKKREEFQLPKLEEANILSLEKEIDFLDSELEPLKNFVLPGGHMTASYAHICRVTTRKVERSYIAFLEISPEEELLYTLQFLNRLSDYFFVLARYLNHTFEFTEIIWK